MTDMTTSAVALQVLLVPCPSSIFIGLIGLNAQGAENAADNGIVYFILSQSLIGVVVIWLAIFLCADGQTSPSRNYLHAIGIFIPLNSSGQLFVFFNQGCVLNLVFLRIPLRARILN